jgi:hypothetical protein
MDISTTSIDQLPMTNIMNDSNAQSTTYNPNIIEKAPTDVLQQIKEELSNITNPLPSRDIPQNTLSVVQDIQTTPDYIPSSNQYNYIEDDTNKNDEIIYNYNRIERISENVNSLYEEFQYPLLIGILYFIFQLPIFKTSISIHFPYLITKENTYNFYGYIFVSFLYSLSFTFLFKVIQMNKIQ